MSSLKISILNTTVKNVTRQERLWLQQESFRLTNVQISMENKFSKIDFSQYDDLCSLDVFDKELQKTVSLHFDFNSNGSVYVFNHFWKQKRTAAFWKKPSLQIVKTTSYEIENVDEINDENINFVWDRIPEFLINLK